jgi:hypothetical protein
MKHDKIVHDASYEHGKDYGSITCPKCNRHVIYGLHCATRPKYCPDCERIEFTKIAQSETSDLIRENKATMTIRIMQELRMPMSMTKRKTVQELVGECNGV